MDEWMNGDRVKRMDVLQEKVLTKVRKHFIIKTKFLVNDAFFVPQANRSLQTAETKLITTENQQRQ